MWTRSREGHRGQRKGQRNRSSSFLGFVVCLTLVGQEEDATTWASGAEIMDARLYFFCCKTDFGPLDVREMEIKRGGKREILDFN